MPIRVCLVEIWFLVEMDEQEPQGSLQDFCNQPLIIFAFIRSRECAISVCSPNSIQVPGEKVLQRGYWFRLRRWLKRPPMWRVYKRTL